MGSDNKIHRQPLSTLQKLVVTFVIGGSAIGVYFAYHVVGAIAAGLEDDFGLTSSQLGQLYTAYSIPNLAILFCSGVLMDRYGIAAVSFVFSALCVLGNVIFACAPADDPMPTLLAGRFVFGMGGEAMVAAVFSMCARWFADDPSFINMAMGLVLALTQVCGSGLVFYLLPSITENQGLRTSMWINTTVVFFSFLCLFVYITLEKAWFAEPASGLVPAAAAAAAANAHGVLDAAEEKEKAPAEPENGQAFLLDSTAGSDGELAGAVSSAPSRYGYCETFRTLSTPSWWAILVIVFCTSPPYYTFTAFGVVYFENMYGMSEEMAGYCAGIPYFVMVLTPLLGHWIDNTGRRLVWHMCAAALLTVTTICFLIEATWLPWMLVCVLGFAFGITESNAYAMMALISDEKAQGMSMSFFGVAVNLGLIWQPVAMGALKDASGSYEHGTMLLAGMLCAGLVMSAGLFVSEMRTGGVLVQPADELLEKLPVVAKKKVGDSEKGEDRMPLLE